MIYEDTIIGRYVDLRSANEEDAEFTLDIRQDPNYIKFIPRINNTLEEQREWIRNQRKKVGDYFFVVFDKKGNRIGTISIYNIDGDTAEAGRLVMNGNMFQNFEAQLLSFRFGFNQLELNEIISFIYIYNERALRFTKQFGGILHEPYVNKSGQLECKVTNSKEDFNICEKKLSSFLYR